MSYIGSGQFPVERASKIGHMKLIQEPNIQKMLSEFESTDPTTGESIGYKSGHIDADCGDNIKFIIAVDGGQAVVPNEIRSEKRLAFISVCALKLDIHNLDEMRLNPIIDPRDFPKKVQTWNNPAIIPLSGISYADETVGDTIRKSVDSTLHYTGLYHTLKFLVCREWDPKFVMGSGDAPHFRCRKCGETIYVPKSNYSFRCPNCRHRHTLSDYLGIGESSPDEWAREESASALRDVLETLTLFHYVRIYYTEAYTIGQILFMKDGPLLLRAGLYRLSDSIREFIKFLIENKVPLYMIGIEKNGEIVNHLDEIKGHLTEIGDFFLPSTKYIIENIRGYIFDPSTYRNRVQYGAKVVARIGPHHVIPLDIPTGDFILEPALDNLYGFKECLSILAKITCYKYENALIPIVLANEYASISQQPSGDILLSFAARFFS